MNERLPEQWQRANAIFNENMERDGMSYLPAGLIARADLKEGMDVLTALRRVKIDRLEHPNLYKPKRFQTVRYFEHSKRKLQKVRL